MMWFDTILIKKYLPSCIAGINVTNPGEQKK